MRSPKKFKAISLVLLACAAFLFASAGRAEEAKLHYSISMERPTMHYFHVVLRCEGLPGESHEFKMPAWTPGYYRIMDYAKNVVSFRAVDSNGRELRWEKTAKNIWKVTSGRIPVITVSYDVYGFNRFVADSYLGDDCAFITPAGVFMHIAGLLKNSVMVEIKPWHGWSRISTGLDPVPGKADTFYAGDFDTLYDCPILVGNQEVLGFEVRGVPHEVAAVNLGEIDRKKFTNDLELMVKAAISVIGDIPYRRYIFLIIGPGGGGLEHLNSAALTLNPAGLNTPAGYRSWLNFAAHEFFHLYNVKSIRPIALGPFDYDRENYTKMLWVSEGFTVYYESLILNRAGLLPRQEALDKLGSVISRYENSPGRRIQSAEASSFDTWLNFFSRDEHAANTSVSYYDAGAVLGLLLDLKIRHESANRASLDDVMKTLYREFCQKRKRGFTDGEFRDVCESMAGAKLDGIFEGCAEAAGDIDYSEYFSYAGLEIDDGLRELPGGFLGAVVQERNGSPVVVRVEWNSPAAEAGLSSQDEIIALDGVRVTTRAIDETLASRKSGEKIRVLYARRNNIGEVEIVLGKKTERSFRLKPVSGPTDLQRTILESWLK